MPKINSLVVGHLSNGALLLQYHLEALEHSMCQELQFALSNLEHDST